MEPSVKPTSSNGVTGQAATQTVRAGLAYRFGVK
jgi:opacity protein-like surface antigen